MVSELLRVGSSAEPNEQRQARRDVPPQVVMAVRVVVRGWMLLVRAIRVGEAGSARPERNLVWAYVHA